ncbi:CheW-like protein [Pseudoduganella flava]|uniref:CheW-like protein n=1 Tax=Pseudoduganella flava TaxID=871742 RepID=A0A562PHY3_9BURK|nr:chemotaxis protein CheW [Pseudoduganella flava]QGZ42815.1 hypothetical protein GO485_29770 [Pseudoduganella flava]TWI44082.1 CheW-like protein [Pseudoduganella flava]
MSAAAPTRRFAVVAIGALTVGIDVDCVVQALPMPAALVPLPRRRGALAGVVDCQGTLIPVADLARWVDTGASSGAAAARRILVLRDGGRRIGLLVDAIDGFADVPADAIARLHHDDDAEEVFQAAAKVPGSETILSVLETGRLVALACAWHGDDGPSAASAAQAPVEQAAVRVLCAVLQAGGVLLALPAVRLAAVLPRPALEPVGGGATAFCRWGERLVPVVAASDAVPELAPTTAGTLLAIVEHAGTALGMLVDAALDMRELALPDGPVPVVHGEDGQAIAWIDVPALFARHPETALSKAAGGAGAPVRNVNDGELLVFEAGGTLATPLDGIEQVLPFDGADGNAPATMPWQGRAIAVTDLRGAGARSGQGAMLVLRAGGGHAACIVERVRSLVPRGTGEVYSLAQPGQGGPACFIAVRDGERTASYRIDDLAERVRRR